MTKAWLCIHEGTHAELHAVQIGQPRCCRRALGGWLALHAGAVPFPTDLVRRCAQHQQLGGDAISRAGDSHHLDGCADKEGLAQDLQHLE